VDIHSEPSDITKAKEACKTAEIEFPDQVLLPKAVSRTDCTDRKDSCEKCIDNGKETSKSNDALQQDCETCKVGRAKSLHKHLNNKTSLKDSLKDSIRNILEAVGTLRNSGSPKMSHKLDNLKKSRSLSELSDSKPVQTTFV